MKGLKAENRVASSLRRTGAKVELSPGSRGSADIVANWPGKEWMVQVKSSNTGQPADLSFRERQNIVSRAKNNNATAVLAQVTSKKIEYSSVATKRKLKP